MALISKIRQRVGLLVFLIALAIVMFLVMDAFDSRTGIFGSGAGMYAGTVDGEKISMQDYENKAQQVIDNRGNDVTEADRLQMRESAWDNMVQESIAQRQYKLLGLDITDDELRALFTDEKNLHPSLRQATLFFDETGKFSIEKMREYVNSFNDENVADAAERRARWKSFEESVYAEQLRKRYTSLIKKAVYTPAFFAQENNRETGQKADIRYVLVPYETVADADITVTDSDLKSYISQNANLYQNKFDTRNIAYLSFPVEASQADRLKLENEMREKAEQMKTTTDIDNFMQVQFSDTPYDSLYKTKDQLTTSVKDTLFTFEAGTVYGPYFEANSYRLAKILDKKMVADSAQIRQIVRRPNTKEAFEADKKIIDSLLAVVKNGGDFAALAAQFSQDEGSKTQGGKLPYTKFGGFNGNVLNNAIFAKQQQGDIFKIIAEDGVYIVEILNAKPSKQALKLAILTKNIEASQATTDSIYNTASAIVTANKTYEELKSAAQQRGLTLKDATDLKRSDYNIPGLGVANDVVAWAFKGKLNSVSESVFQINGKNENGSAKTDYVIAALTGVKTKGLSTPEDVRAKVEPLVKRQKKMAQIAAKIGSAATLDEVASATSQQVQTAVGLDFKSPNLPNIGREPKLQGTIFGLQPKQVSKPIEGEKGVYVVELSSLTDAPQSGDITQQKANLNNMARQPVDMSVLPALVKKADITDNRFAVRR
ncbi:MAG: SurA N-terminal domain-containing protein [Sphingobacteriales bacterium]|jgi:peptidyl-prolyl cis-trans isomerase D|nr:SurA N-terminal domain-containing protein [Sphingobacteriales bacterium]MBP9141542.1 SurA N-terminal domain-containing protein [Chitinophagales bacterium]MDA0198385.1 SurA N-terminal domain-containing protein [Bacteroidota bacterium]MBK7527098.1 SurA N-terminal domain-containing protein [Sphingobacteriales bacterium]MBL0247766.1 SurA N-terminal domain-containing protein [Sphingobacteriales bacterium]